MLVRLDIFAVASNVESRIVKFGVITLRLHASNTMKTITISIIHLCNLIFFCGGAAGASENFGKAS